ncbi:N-acetyltransferase [Fictibacillus nanhaiensis]|nr:N-acetyltransferase [Fictibacillus nanhaiensis]
MEIRAEQKEDHVAIGNIHSLAFKGENEARLVNKIRESEFFVPQLSLVADSDEIVGHILLSVVHIQTEESLIPTLALAPMAVLPHCQNQNIGSKLVEEALRRAGKLGFSHVVVLGHPGFYPRFGFVSAMTKGIKPPFPVLEEVFMVHEMKKGSLNHIKGTVVYPPAFNAVT